MALTNKNEFGKIPFVTGILSARLLPAPGIVCDPGRVHAPRPQRSVFTAAPAGCTVGGPAGGVPGEAGSADVNRQGPGWQEPAAGPPPTRCSLPPVPAPRGAPLTFTSRHWHSNAAPARAAARSRDLPGLPGHVVLTCLKNRGVQCALPPAGGSRCTFTAQDPQ